MRRRIDETRAYRTEMNDLIFKAGSKNINRFFALDGAAYDAGALDTKSKELMGLVASLVLRCNDCIFYHLDRCVEENCTREELNEAMNIGLVVGGSIVIPHLRYAFEMLESLLPPEAPN